MFTLISAAAAPAASANPYGLWEALEQGGVIAWSVFIILVGMSIGSFFILFSKLLEQQKVISQAKKVRQTFWRAPSLKEASAKLEKNSAYKQLVDDGITAHRWCDLAVHRSVRHGYRYLPRTYQNRCVGSGIHRCGCRSGW